MRAAADRHDVGVALDQPDAVDLDAEPFADALRKAGLVALAARQRADGDVDAAFRMHMDLGVFARRAAGDFEIVRKPDAAQLAGAFGFALALVEALPVRQRERAVHDLAVVAAVVGHAERVGVGLRLRRNEIAAAQVDAVIAELLGGDVDHPLDGVDRLGPAGAAIGVGRRRVGQRRAGADVRRRHPIDRGQQLGAFHQRHVHDAVRAGVADHRAAQREEAAFVVERELQRDRLVAALVVAGEGLRALAGPFHRAAELLGRPHHQRELRIEGVARAVVAADVAALDAHVGHRHAEDRRELVLLPDHAAGAGVQRVLVGRRIVDADRGARVERHAGDALHPGLEFRHMGRARERRLGRRRRRRHRHRCRHWRCDRKAGCFDWVAPGVSVTAASGS